MEGNHGRDGEKFSWNCTIDFEYEDGYPPVINNDKQTQKLKTVVKKIIMHIKQLHE